MLGGGGEKRPPSTNRVKVIAMVKRFVRQQRLGTNKILSNRFKLASARASETKSVWVFLRYLLIVQ